MVSGNPLPSDYHQIPVSSQDLGSHKFKDNQEAEQL
jgi:hypothetical protein